jgi:biotin transport system substrate-specific component
LQPKFTSRDLALTAMFAALTCVGAWVSIPFFGPVPFTLQVFCVLLAGLVLGARLGALSMLVYVAVGLIAPVYAGGASGVGALFGPTGGYIWGFVAAAALVGSIAQRSRTTRTPWLASIAAVGLVPIYAVGVLWLDISLGLPGIGKAIAIGAAPFVWMDLVKALCAALVARALVSSPLGLPALAER